MKKETRRYYEFTFEQLTKALKLEGNFVNFEILKKDDIPSGDIKIITIVVDEDSK